MYSGAMHACDDARSCRAQLRKEDRDSPEDVISSQPPLGRGVCWAASGIPRIIARQARPGRMLCAVERGVLILQARPVSRNASPCSGPPASSKQSPNAASS